MVSIDAAAVTSPLSSHWLTTPAAANASPAGLRIEYLQVDTWKAAATDNRYGFSSC
jgi:hypothetical protein